MNPYVVSSVNAQDYVVSTTIKQVPTLMEGLEEEATMELGDPFDGRTYKPVNPRLIGNGPNNVWLTDIALDFTMLDNY